MFFQVKKDQENIQLFPAPVQNKSSLSLGKKRVWREGGGRRGEQLENGFLKVKLKICTTICWRTFFWNDFPVENVNFEKHITASSY